MNNKTLFLLVATVVASGIVSNDSFSYVQAREFEQPNGAIIRQLPTGNSKEYKNLEKRTANLSKVEQAIAKIQYFEKTANYKLSDETFKDAIDYIKEYNTESGMKRDLKLLQKYFEELIYQEPYNQRYLYKKSVVENALGNTEAAEDCIRDALKIDQNNPVYLYELAKIHLLNNRYDKGIKIIEGLKRQYPRELEYRLALAQAYTQYGKYDDAIREYKVAANFDPQNNDTIVALNELMQYNEYQKQFGGQQFYDPMRNVKTDSGIKQASSATTADSGTKGFVTAAQPAVSKTTRPTTSTASNIPQVPVSARKATNIQRTAPRTAPGTKRVMVSYVNGRKVVKIVNVNSDSTTPTSLQDASNTFNNQLEELNSGRSTSGSSKSNSSQYSYSSSYTPQSTGTSASTSVNTNSKYHLVPSEYVSSQSSGISSNQTMPEENLTAFQQMSETTSSGDPNIKSLKYNNNSLPNQKRLLVTYENGKRVVKTAGSVNKTQNTAKQDTADKTTKKDKKKEKDKVKKSEAAKTTNTATSQDNTDLYIKANEYLAQEKFQEAIDVLKQVQPPTLRSLTAMASCYNSLGKVDTAIDYYKEADKLSPSNTQILYSIGYLYYAKNDTAAAEKYIDMALKADATNQNAIQLKKYMSQNVSNESINKAVTYMNQGNYNESRKILEKAIQDKPTDFQAYYYLGHIYYATQKYEDSVRNFTIAIKNNPDYALSYYSIGLAYDKLKEFNKSILAYQQFLQMENDDNKYTQYAKTRINTIKSKQ